jgi:L-seryl-tRNA(Ser) seleniumtransferase
MSDLRHLPSVDSLLNSPSTLNLLTQFGRPQTISALRDVLDQIRKEYTSTNAIPTSDEILNLVEKKLQTRFRISLLPVINATGTILHTNLGRAPLSQFTLDTMQAISTGYNNLEYDLKNGKRGSRSVHAEELLTRLTGAEAATVVNNNAGAVLIVLSAIANRRKVLISRSQLIEIGGGFRIPDVMKQSGAKLFEIGTTNRIHLSDYENALSEESIKLVMRAHQSNFKIIGFTTEPDFADIIKISHQFQVPVLDDLGSGTFVDTAQFGLTHEPTIQESVLAGADLITFSGDKLLGGPQAGIIIGKKELIQKIKKHPLARALRPDKLTLAGLSATLIHYLKDEHLTEIPIWRMISAPIDFIKIRAAAWQTKIPNSAVIPNLSTIGGGSMPEETLATFVLAVQVNKPDQLLNALRENSPAIVARVENDQVLFDPRTVLPEQDNIFIQNLSLTVQQFL